MYKHFPNKNEDKTIKMEVQLLKIIKDLAPELCSEIA